LLWSPWSRSGLGEARPRRSLRARAGSVAMLGWRPGGNDG
jgi:hypothetical protein